MRLFFFFPLFVWLSLLISLFLSCCQGATLLSTSLQEETDWQLAVPWECWSFWEALVDVCGAGWKLPRFFLVWISLTMCTILGKSWALQLLYGPIQTHFHRNQTIILWRVIQNKQMLKFCTFKTDSYCFKTNPVIGFRNVSFTDAGILSVHGCSPTS